MRKLTEIEQTEYLVDFLEQQILNYIADWKDAKTRLEALKEKDKEQKLERSEKHGIAKH